MKGVLLLTGTFGMAFCIGFAISRIPVAQAESPVACDAAHDREQVRELLLEMRSADIASMPALSVEKFTVPTAGVDVMRAVVEENYVINGIGNDNVELRGWIAVAHGHPIAGDGK